MIKSKSSILKSLGVWDYDEIKIPEPNNDQAIVKIISCGICSTGAKVQQSQSFSSSSEIVIAASW